MQHLHSQFNPTDNKDAPRALADFVLHCSSCRLTKETPNLRLRIRQIWTELPPDIMQLTDLAIAPLLKKMRDGNFLADDYGQFLSHYTHGEVVTLSMDEDIQNAVWEAQSMGAKFIHIQVTTANDHDQFLLFDRIFYLI